MKMKPYDLHDYTIDDLAIDPCRGTLSVHMLSPYSGATHGPVVYEEELLLVFAGVQKVHMSEFFRLNIVLDVAIFTEPDNSDYYRLCRQSLNLDEDWNKSLSNKIIYIVPTAGLELFCQYSDLEIRPVAQSKD